MTNGTNTKREFDLEDRTQGFAKQCRVFVKKLPKNATNYEDIKQLMRASGSVGANYIEANESISKKDFTHRVKIARKEAKEVRYWLRLVDCGVNSKLEQERQQLINEATQFMKMFGEASSRSRSSWFRIYTFRILSLFRVSDLVSFSVV